MPTITPTRTSTLRLTFGRAEMSLVAVVAAALAATGLVVALGPLDALALTSTLSCA